MALLEFLTDNWAIILPPLLGLVSVYLLLPKPRRTPVLYGAAAAGLALVLTAVLIVRVGRLSSPELFIEGFLFYTLAATAIVSGGLLITQENPARAALSFAIVVLASTGLFLLQAAPFLMAATIIVYAGAIIVTFLFVLMLAQQQGLSDADARSREPFLASATGFLLLVALLYILKITYKPALDTWVDRSEQHLASVEKFNENAKPDEKQTQALVKDIREFLAEYTRWLTNEWRSPEEISRNKQAPRRPPPEGQKLEEAIKEAEGALFPVNPTPEQIVKWLKKPSPEEQLLVNPPPSRANLLDRLAKLVETGKQTRNDPLLGGLRLRPGKAAALSELSGPRSNRAVHDLRRDEATGRPHLPAENTTYLGRSLFTDYLLPVEMAGTLLLVAAIGAIAIAQRQQPRRQTPAGPASPGRTA